MSAALDLLLSSAWRGALLAAGAWTGCLLLRHRVSAAVRHRCLAMALIALAMMPVFIACCDGWAVLPPITTSAPLVSVAVPAKRPTATPVINRAPQVVSMPMGSAEPLATARVVESFPWPLWLATGWALVSLILLSVIGREAWRLRRLRRNAMPCVDASLGALANECAKALRLCRAPEIRLMQNNTGPMVAGFFRCTVLLPPLAVQWPEERQRAVLLHELAHVKRRDGLMQLIGALTCALHWCNPFAWLLLKHLRQEAECACDNVVLGADMASATYANHLLAVAASGRPASAWAPSMAQPSGLRQRVRLVLSQSVRRGSVGRMVGFAIGIAATVVSLPVMLAQTAPVKPPAAKPTTTAEVSIITVDAAGHPLGGVELAVFDTGKPGPMTPFAPDVVATTDSEGRWQGTLAMHDHLFRATKGTLVVDTSFEQGYFVLTESKPPFQRTLILREGGTVDVHVMAATTNAPVANAKVVLDSGHCAITDASGTAHLTSVPMGDRAVRCVAPPLADVTIFFNSTTQPVTKVEATMPPGFEVRGRVLNEDGVPVKDATVDSASSGQAMIAWLRRCNTDADGQYQIGWFPKSKPLMYFNARHKDYAELSQQDLPPPLGGDTVHWDLIMDRGREVTGVVKDEAGNPIKNAHVSWGPGVRAARSDAEGRFRILKIGVMGVDNARPALTQAAGFAPAWQTVMPGKGKDTPDLTFTLKPGLTVKGRVVDREGKPVADMIMMPLGLVERRHEFLHGAMKSDANGEFVLKDLPNRDVRLNASKKGYSFISDLEVDPHQPLLITVDKASVIIGKVVDAVTHRPVKTFNVRLEKPKQTPPGEPKASISAQINDRGQDCKTEDGTFVVDTWVTGARYDVIVSAEGYSRVTTEIISQPADDKNWPVEIAVGTGIEIAGQLTDAVTGQPVSGAKVLYVGKEKWESSYIYAPFLADLRTYPVFDDVETVLSDGQGRVALHLPGSPKEYTAIVMADGYGPQLIDQQPVSQTRLQVKPLERECKVRGTVAGLAGFDPARDAMYLQMDIYHTNALGLRPDGSFEATGLPAGPCAVTARDADGRVVKASVLVTLTPGQTTTVDLTRDSPSSLDVIVTVDGQPAEGKEIEVLTKRPDQFVSLGSGTTGKDGKLHLTHLPAVQARVLCQDSQSQSTLPADLTDFRVTPVVRFDLKTPPAK